MNVEQMLDRLYVLRADAIDLQLEKERSQSAIIPQEIKDKLNILEEEYALKFVENQRERDQLEMTIREAVAVRQENYKGASGMSALFMPGRVSWDTRGLEGYAKANKAVLAFRKVGEPFVTIKGV